MSDANVSKKMTLMQKIEGAQPAVMVSLPEVEERFKHIYTVVNGGNTQVAMMKYESEKFHFAKLIQDSKDLQQCTKLSLYGCFMDMAVNGLSFDPAAKQAYVVSFNTNIGTKQSPKWEKRATLMISGYGELALRMKQGQIKYADNPILAYEGDEFSYGTKGGRVYLEHVAKFPRQSDKIIAVYLRIERNDSTVDYKVLGMEEIEKIRKFSKDPNSKAWTDGFPGMVQAKVLKHAFRSYPKIKIAPNSVLQTETIEAQPEQPVIDYGLNDTVEATQTPQASQTQETPNKPPQTATQGLMNAISNYGAAEDDDSFAQRQNDDAATVQYNDDNF